MSSDSDLRQLAFQRASAAKDYLLSTNKVEANRLFIIEPKIETGASGKETQPRVRFNLK